MFKRTKINAGVLLGLGALATLSASAQEASQRIEITGSLIRRIDGETALPVTTIKLDEVQRAGATNAEGVVKLFTQNQGGVVTSGSVSGTNGAASYANLRSLGEGRTLVLLNGRRVANNPYGSDAVDLNILPIGALDRIETLSDGASATYGTDAIAGVINFITRRDYRGFLVNAQAQVPQKRGGAVYTADLTGGIGNFASDGWNVMASLNFRDQKPLLGTDRDFMKTAYRPDLGFNALSGTTFPGNYSQTSAAGTTVIANTNPSLPGCSPPTSILATAVATNRCNADTQAFTQVIPIQKQIGFFLKGSLALGSDHTAGLEYFKSNNKVQTQIAPSPETGLTMTPASPYYPGNGITPITDPALDPTRNITVGWRTVGLGTRRGVQENNTQRFVANVEGSFFNWDYNVAALWSNAKLENTFLNGYPKTQALRDGVSGANGAPYLNPFGDQSAAGLAYLLANQVLGKVQDGEQKISGVSASAGGTLAKLPAGPLTVALGLESRKEDMVYNTDIAKVSQAASSGLAGSGAVRQGDRNISAVALEFNVPVIKGLEAGLSVRADKYSDFGNTTNPKLALRYKPIDMLLLRGSVNTGFAAPSLYNLYLPNSTTFTSNRYNDPVLCPGGVPTAQAVPSRDCGLQFQKLQGGNAGLSPEKSSAWTVGFVLQPIPSVTVGLDFWYYKIKNSISTVGEQTIFSDPVKYAGLFVRCSQASAALQASLGACQNPGAADPLAYIIDTNQNLGDIKTSGIDLQASWTGAATPVGRFNASARGTYVQKYLFQVEPRGTWFDANGNYSAQFTQDGGTGGPVIRYQQITTFGWEREALSARLINRFKTGYIDQNSGGAPFNVAPFNTHRVASYSLWDVTMAYSGFIKGMTLSAGVLNLFDTDPPYSNQTGRFQARLFDDRFHNPLGRTFQIAGRYEY